MPDRLRASDLTDDHLGRRVRVDGHEGILRARTPVDDELMQLLLIADGRPLIPTVGIGTPVELIDYPPP